MKKLDKNLKKTKIWTFFQPWFVLSVAHYKLLNHANLHSERACIL